MEFLSILLIHSSVDGHLSCFPLGTIMNKAAMKFIHKLLFEHLFLIVFGIFLEMELMSHVVILCNFLSNHLIHS